MWNDVVVTDFRCMKGKCLGVNVCHVVVHHLPGYHSSKLLRKSNCMID